MAAIPGRFKETLSFSEFPIFDLLARVGPMLLHDIRKQFASSISVCDGFFRLMQKNFGFYANLCNLFFGNLASRLEQGKLNEFLQTDIRTRLFDPNFCQGLEESKKQFLAEIIKLEQFIASGRYEIQYLNDLEALKAVANNIYELLQGHWELYKYQRQELTTARLISFVLEIDRISIGWDAFLEKYVAVSKLLKETGLMPVKPGLTPLKLHYHLPPGMGLSLQGNLDLMQFLLAAYEFMAQVYGIDPQQPAPELLNQESQQPVSLVLWLPDALAPGFAKLLNYLSIDLIKRETLVKYVMEVVAMGQGQEPAKAALAASQKKMAKLLEAFPQGAYLSIDEQEMLDSVQLLAKLTQELDRIQVDYKDLLQAANRRLARNQRIAEASAAAAPAGAVAKPTEPPKKAVGDGVKIDIAGKEHHGFLTS